MIERFGDASHTVVLDWDGTLVEGKWPEMGDWLPGAKEAVRDLLRHGVNVVVFSARLSPYDPFTMSERDPAHVESEISTVRGMLDAAGLREVGIWTLAGKPGGSVYVDDKAIWYPGRPRSWQRILPKIYQRLDMHDAMFPPFEHDGVR